MITIMRRFAKCYSDFQLGKYTYHNYQWCGWGSFQKTETEAVLTRPRRGEAAENQAEARPRQGSQKTM